MKRLTIVGAMIACGLVGAVLVAVAASATPGQNPQSRAGGLPRCLDDLAGANAALAACQAQPHTVFPGDGAGNGPPLSYNTNADGTITDNNTGLTWEQKNSNGGVHDVEGTYAWSRGGSVADGTLFTEFLATLNNKCDGNEIISCTSDTPCSGIGSGLCGYAGHRDWRIPNVRELQSVVDFGRVFPAIDPTFVTTRNSSYWSFTTRPASSYAYNVDCGDDGTTYFDPKSFRHAARAVRGGLAH